MGTKERHLYLRFLERAVEWSSWGEAEFAYCDVERALQREIRKLNYLGRYQLNAVESFRTTEMAILERLETKYRPVAIQRVGCFSDSSDRHVPDSPRGSGSSARQPSFRRPACCRRSFNFSNS